MDLRHCRMMVEVARQGNLTKAASNLFLTQSALSHQLKELETLFESRLFLRRKRKMELTTQGKLVLQLCEEILGKVENTKKNVVNLDDEDAGAIRICTQCHLAYFWLSSFMKEFRVLYPRVELSVLPEATYHAIEYLQERKIDLAITDDTLGKNVRYVPLFKDEFVVIVSDEHPWSKRKWVDPDAFLEETFIMYDIPPSQSTVYQFIFGRRSPKKLLGFRVTEVVIEMVKANQGVAVLPTWVVAPYRERGGISELRLTKKGYRRTWYGAMLPDQEVCRYTNDFLRLLSKHMKKSDTLMSTALA